LLKSTEADASVLQARTASYATLIENLQQSSEERFCDLKQKGPQITFLINPFTAESDCLKVPFVANEAAS